ncbi:hypothetical protein KQI61_04490 [Anaerocolumna aminovalerica]|nr:hypothetical protein [Anaerocolumna aminovalerica]MBU5331446.1 hypothetical protein [Anaerocolumna aminovalerica]
MSEEKKKLLENMATKFTKQNEEVKDKFSWYLLGRYEEREEWEKKLQTA